MYTDGIQNGHPFVFQGRDNGVTYWGDFSKVKVSAGVFDGQSATGDPEVLAAARVQIDFWDKENGYYLNGTYYGAKNLLGVGAAIQAQDGDTATTVDFLLEKKLGEAAGSSPSRASTPTTTSSAATTRRYGRARARTCWGFLFPKPVGMGKFEVLGKYAEGDLPQGGALEPTTTRTRPSSTSTTSSRSSTRD